MKELNQYIQEKLIVNNTISNYLYHPKTKDKLITCIKEKIDKEGLGTKDEPLDLNDIDTSQITNMNSLFSAGENDKLQKLSENGYFDISNWDVSKVTSMHSIFYDSGFDGDISNWDVSNVENMKYMFSGSKFTGKNGNISDWNVSSVKDMSYMFEDSAFSTDISGWDVSNVENMKWMFAYCPLEKNPPKWYLKY